jgi:hypothetical protein
MTSQDKPTFRPRRAFIGFDRERATYERIKSELFTTAQGKFVVIVGDEFLAPIDNYDDALRAGYARFGPGPLYIRELLDDQSIEVIASL